MKTGQRKLTKCKLYLNYFKILNSICNASFEKAGKQ